MAAFNIEDLTNRQIAEIEDLTNKSFPDLFIDGRPSWLLTAAGAYITLRATDPDITFEKIMDGSYEIVADVIAGNDPKDEND